MVTGFYASDDFIIAGVPVKEINFAVVNETGPAFAKEGGGGILGYRF